MRIILSSNPYRDHGLRVAMQARQILEKAGAETVFCLPFQPKKGETFDFPQNLVTSDLQQELDRADILICFGGDGTILHAARDASKHNVPILGVNTGNIGFMAELEKGELSKLEKLPNSTLKLEERMMIQATVMRGNRIVSRDVALNDVVFSKGGVPRVAEMEVWTDGALITRLQGDGVLIATPTGSTAYSMSAGGPIVEPTARSIIITPICAHQLSARTMVLSAERNIMVRLPKGSRKSLYMAIDGGKGIRLGSGERVEIQCAERVTKLVRLRDRNFYEILNQKLGGQAK